MFYFSMHRSCVPSCIQIQYKIKEEMQSEKKLPNSQLNRTMEIRQRCQTAQHHIIPADDDVITEAKITSVSTYFTPYNIRIDDLISRGPISKYIYQSKRLICYHFIRNVTGVLIGIRNVIRVLFQSIDHKRAK